MANQVKLEFAVVAVAIALLAEFVVGSKWKPAPTNFEECVLTEIRGLPAAVRGTVTRLCRSRFPHGANVFDQFDPPK